MSVLRPSLVSMSMGGVSVNSKPQTAAPTIPLSKNHGWTLLLALAVRRCRPSMMAEFVAAEKESKRISSLHFGGEQGEQAALGL